MDFIINKDYVRLSTNFYIHHVRLSRNLYIHYVRLSTSYIISSSFHMLHVFKPFSPLYVYLRPSNRKDMDIQYFFSLLSRYKMSTKKYQ